MIFDPPWDRSMMSDVPSLSWDVMSTSKRWLKEHFSDPYVKKAQSMGYASRAAYKLLAIQEKIVLLNREWRLSIWVPRLVAGLKSPKT